MNIIIESPHFTVNTLLEEYVTKKVSKLANLNDRLMRAEVVLKLDKSDSEDNKICEIKILAPRKNFFASCKCSTFEVAVNEVVHSIEKQLRKQKTRFSKGTEKLNVEDTTGEETEE